MIDAKAFHLELQEARKIRLRAQAAGRYLDALVRHMHRTRRPWQQWTPLGAEAQVSLLPN